MAGYLYKIVLGTTPKVTHVGDRCVRYGRKEVCSEVPEAGYVDDHYNRNMPDDWMTADEFEEICGSHIEQGYGCGVQGRIIAEVGIDRCSDSAALGSIEWGTQDPRCS